MGSQISGTISKRNELSGEIIPLSEMFFHEMPELGEEEQEVINGEQVPELMTHLYGKLEALEPFEADIKKTIKEVQKETGIKGKQLFMPIRVVRTGQMHGLNYLIQLKY